MAHTHTHARARAHTEKHARQWPGVKHVTTHNEASGTTVGEPPSAACGAVAFFFGVRVRCWRHASL